MNVNYHISKASIKCPYCDKECWDDDYTVTQDLESKTEFECEHCEKKFWASAHVSYDTHSDCELNGIDHDYIATESHPTVFHCRNCSQYEVR